MGCLATDVVSAIVAGQTQENKPQKPDVISPRSLTLKYIEFSVKLVHKLHYQYQTIRKKKKNMKRIQQNIQLLSALGRGLQSRELQLPQSLSPHRACAIVPLSAQGGRGAVRLLSHLPPASRRRR